MKFAWTWMTVASGALLMGGWGSGASTDADLPVIETRTAEVADGCAAESMRWSYDAEGRSLSLNDGRVQLNCCGHRSMQVERVDNVLEVTERDTPDEGGRCASTCSFDLATTISNVGQGEVFVKLLRDVTDENGSAVLVWQGSLDLANGSGTVMVERSVSEQCQVAAR
ncbi:MAG TPA: hypothetical protein VLS89_08635 [Candidatus Nanopelagicales bacterium]|nr:hypothetical protein [Candidatus Nanopelagicales bacterium]